MTRALQDRLTLANVKIQNGWENLSLDTIEPRIEMELKRKRSRSRNEGRSDTSSSISDRFYPAGMLDSSPLTAPMFSDSVGRSGGSYGHSKRVKYQLPVRQPASSSHARTKVRTPTTRASSWKSSYRLPESSPAYHTRHARFSVSHVPSLSFISEASTVPDGPASPLLSLSEDDDADLPVSSFRLGPSHMRSSPPRTPRTPPPGLARSARSRNKAFNPTSVNPQPGGEGADLLMFFAASPSPAQAGKRTQTCPPSTPPPKATPLPSSMMTTPGDAGFFDFGPATPGMPFNFADFVNVTPSPGQAGWNRTPGAARTPLAAREARRRLNFDSIMPPTGASPNVGMSVFGLEIGGDLVPSQ